VALFAIFYIVSPGATAYRRDKLMPWLKEAWGIARHQPVAIGHLNSHARRAILTHIRRGEKPDDPQNQYFSRWDASYLRFQMQAVNDIPTSRASLGFSLTTALIFPELYRFGKLKISGASAFKPDSSRLLLRPSSEVFRVEITPPTHLRIFVISNHISIHGSVNSHTLAEEAPFSNYVRFYWLDASAHSEEQSFSGERSFPIDLRDLAEKGIATSYLGDNYLWLSSGEITRFLLEFSLTNKSEVSLERVDFPPVHAPVPTQKVQPH
jgi:hypothetical protein